MKEEITRKNISYDGSENTFNPFDNFYDSIMNLSCITYLRLNVNNHQLWNKLLQYVNVFQLLVSIFDWK